MRTKGLCIFGVFFVFVVTSQAAESPGPTEKGSSFSMRAYPLPESKLKQWMPPTVHQTGTVTTVETPVWIVKNDELKKLFTDLGVPFPTGADVTYNHRMGVLAVMNTPENLDLMDRVFLAQHPESMQVTVEVRFLQLPRTLAEDVFAEDGGLSRASIIKEGILKRVDDLARHGKITELARPKLATVSGNTAQVKAVREVRFPDIGLSSPLITTNEVRPRESWEGTSMTREVGYLLNVTPTVGPDGSTLNITLVPEVSRMAPKPQQYRITTPSGSVTVKQPEFSSYQTTTTVFLKSGQTMLLAVMDPVAEDGKLTQNDVVFVLLSATVVRE